MRFRIHHETQYRYEEPVFLEPHLLRLRPREGPTLRLERYALSVTPGSSPHALLDAEGNVATRVWFDGQTDVLEVVADSEVQTFNDNPFDFVLDAQAEQMPVLYQPQLARRLSLYRRRATGAVDVVAVLSTAARAASGGGTLPFLTALGAEVHTRVRTVRRERGSARPAYRTLAVGHGACRDLAVVYVEACRAEGLAARFVSGYVHAPELGSEPDLHAWAEVYLPGAGWWGYDPSRALAVDAAYVPLAASARPADAAPVTGTYRGRVPGTMRALVTVEVTP